MPRRKMGNEENEKHNGREFGRRLRLLRRRNRQTISDVAEAVGITDVYLSQLERGEKLPSFDTLICLTNALKATPNELLCDYAEVDCNVIASNISSILATLTVAEQYAVERFLMLYIEDIKNRKI